MSTGVNEKQDPGDPRTWLDRGRPPDVAEEVARAWREFPDLPAGTPLNARMERNRARQEVLKSLYARQDAKRRDEQEARNFAFTNRQIASGNGHDRDIAILRGRDQYGYRWMEAVSYADGWHAAHAGWAHRYPSHDLRGKIRSEDRIAYDRGFADGGGCKDDLFDATRRANLAALRKSNQPPAEAPPITARPPPSSWPQPSDAPRPTPWAKRLLIIEECAEQIADRPLPALQMFDGEYFRLLRAQPGHETATIAIVTTRHGVIPGDAVVEPYTPLPAGDATAAVAADASQRERLRAIVDNRDLDDVLVAATDPYLAIVEAHADAIPLCRTMERTRNTVILRRQQFRTWLARGVEPGRNMAGGHIRWGKVHAGLKGSLGEFTAKYTGPLSPRGHGVVVELGDGLPATGYFDATGYPLNPHVTVSNKAHLRTAIASALRSFAAATRLTHINQE